MRSRRTGLVLAVAAAAFWATGGLAAKWLFSPLDAQTGRWILPPLGVTIDPIVLSAARAVVAGALLWLGLVVRAPEHLRIRRRDLPFLGAFGVVGLALVHFSYFKTISLTNVATAILLEYMAPVIVLVASYAVFKTRAGWRLPFAVALSVAGCALVAGAAAGELAVSAEGLAWGLASAAFFASYTVMGRWAAERYTPWTLLAYGLAAASAFWLVVLKGPGPIVAALAEPRTLLAVTYIAVASTIVPFGSFLAALRLLPAAEASVVSTLEPVMAAAGAWILLRERLSAWQIVGGVLVLAGIAIAQTQQRQEQEIPPAT
ncbi:DMT family transporter [Coriobacteriia bacterium Es71-Z0120]|uniref:EamA family transporter n=1 Tax=Parvivirga hydrogeniphila TaxID=2939460 RepID=UPI002260B1C7|nr:DMT family transporter [Parvivirga hydrogeniphila]MCL4078898.1 DMT family transporter [Parvivirga hydrogeniphila]